MPRSVGSPKEQWGAVRLPAFLSRLRAGRAKADPANRLGQYRVLLAITEKAKQDLHGILSGLPVEFASSLGEGVESLGRQRYSHVIVGYLFAESHMFEFARHARRLQPSARVVCVKGAGRLLGAEVRAGLDAAARELGCQGFYDLTARDSQGAFDAAFDSLLAHFPGALDSMPPEQQEAMRELRAAVQRLRYRISA